MKRSDWIAICGMFVGVLCTTIGSTWYLAYKIGSLTERVLGLEKTTDEVKEDIKVIKVDIVDLRSDIADLRSDVNEMKVRLDILWQYHVDEIYPRRMPSKAAIEASKNSEIVKFANQNYNDILSMVKSLEPENARQAEEALISVVGYKKSDSSIQSLRKSAFAKGHDIDSLLVVAALSIRDRVVKDLGFE